MEENKLALNWEDLQKAAKYQVMLAFYGAGQTGQSVRVASELANVLGKRDIAFVTRKQQLAMQKRANQIIRDAERIGAEEVVEQTRNFLDEVNQLIRNRQRPTPELLVEASEIHPDLFDFVERLTAARGDPVGPDVFKTIATIMSEKLSERAPTAQEYINFWKRVGARYANETQKVDIPWVDFAGRTMVQRYRPKVTEEIRFKDPVTGRFVRNIYQTVSDKDSLLSKAYVGNVRLGLGVNGTHTNDSSIVMMFHQWGRKNGIDTATIHDKICCGKTGLIRWNSRIGTIPSEACVSRNV